MMVNMSAGFQNNLWFSSSPDGLFASSLYALSTILLHRTVTYLNCTKSMSVLCLLIVGEGVLIFLDIQFWHRNTCSMSPRIPSTTAFDQHKKTPAWERQLTEGGEYTTAAMCASAQTLAFTFCRLSCFGPPSTTTKEGWKARERSGEERGGNKKDRERERRMKRNAGLASGGVLWCKRNREWEEERGRRGGRRGGVWFTVCLCTWTPIHTRPHTFRVDTIQYRRGRVYTG